MIALLTEDGRLSNRALASAIGLTEPTVAARLRSLYERRILCVTASLDWLAAGYRWDAWLHISVEGRPVKEAARELAAVEGIRQVSVVFGPSDLIALLMLADESDAVDVIADRIGRIEGLKSVRPHVILETVKHETRHARVPIRPIPLWFPAPVVDLDDLDRALIDLLVLDGRQSNRKIARKLSVSEGTIRFRLGRMEEAGLLRITARSDPYLTGEINAWAFIGVDTEVGAARSVAQALADSPETTIVMLVAGSHDILASVATASRFRLLDLVLDEIRALPGVRSSSTWEIVQTKFAELPVGASAPNADSMRSDHPGRPCESCHHCIDLGRRPPARAERSCPVSSARGGAGRIPRRPGLLDQTHSGAVDLARARLAAQLPGNLGHLSAPGRTKRVAAGNETAVGVDRNPSPRTGGPVEHELVAFAHIAQPQGLVVFEFLVGVGIMQLHHVQVLGSHPGILIESLRRLGDHRRMAPGLLLLERLTEHGNAAHPDERLAEALGHFLRSHDHRRATISDRAAHRQCERICDAPCAHDPFEGVATLNLGVRVERPIQLALLGDPSKTSGEVPNSCMRRCAVRAKMVIAFP